MAAQLRAGKNSEHCTDIRHLQAPQNARAQNIHCSAHNKACQKHLKQSQKHRLPRLKCLKDNEEPKKRWHCIGVVLFHHTGLNIAWYTRHHIRTPQPCINQHLQMSVVYVCTVLHPVWRKKGKLVKSYQHLLR